MNAACWISPPGSARIPLEPSDGGHGRHRGMLQAPSAWPRAHSRASRLRRARNPLVAVGAPASSCLARPVRHPGASGRRGYGQFASVMVFHRFCELILIEAAVERWSASNVAARGHSAATLVNGAVAADRRRRGWLSPSRSGRASTTRAGHDRARDGAAAPALGPDGGADGHAAPRPRLPAVARARSRPGERRGRRHRRGAGAPRRLGLVLRPWVQRASELACCGRRASAIAVGWSRALGRHGAFRAQRHAQPGDVLDGRQAPRLVSAISSARWRVACSPSRPPRTAPSRSSCCRAPSSRTRVIGIAPRRRASEQRLRAMTRETGPVRLPDRDRARPGDAAAVRPWLDQPLVRRPRRHQSDS